VAGERPVLLVITRVNCGDKFAGGLCGAITKRHSLEAVASYWLHASPRSAQVNAECKRSASLA